ncbi:hypothetical protein BGZ94_010178 [Podila epigama]|nr:hypothetical protein BGZ94_010178 [Podila epigama]
MTVRYETASDSDDKVTVYQVVAGQVPRPPVETRVLYDAAKGADKTFEDLQRTTEELATLFNVLGFTPRWDQMNTKFEDPFFRFELVLRMYFRQFAELQANIKTRNGSEGADVMRKIMKQTYKRQIAKLQNHMWELIAEIRRMMEDDDIPGAYVHLAQRYLNEDVQECQQKAFEYGYLDAGCKLIRAIYNTEDYPAPALFLVLPVNPLIPLDEDDPETLQFRIHFLCHREKNSSIGETSCKHVHLVNHPGYHLKRPREFFQKYGPYVLAILEMVRHGHSNRDYDVPSLTNRAILWGHDSTQSGLTPDNIASHVFGADQFLQNFLPANMAPKAFLSPKDSHLIQSEYMVIPEGDNGLANLYRHARGGRAKWTCEKHFQSQSIGRFNRLKRFAITSLEDDATKAEKQSCFDMQRGIVKVRLSSKLRANRFLDVVKYTEHKFDMNIKLDWDANRSFLEEYLVTLSETGTAALSVEGLSLTVHPQDNVTYGSDLISTFAMKSQIIRLVRLLDYPQRGDQVVYFGADLAKRDTYRLHMKRPKGDQQPMVHWNDLYRDLDRIARPFRSSRQPDARALASYLKSCSEVLIRHGCLDVKAITIHIHGDRRETFSMDDHTIERLHIYTTQVPTSFLTLGSLLHLTLDSAETNNDTQMPAFSVDDVLDLKRIGDILQDNPKLQTLDISVFGEKALSRLDDVLPLLSSERAIQLTMFERTKDSRGRVLVQLVVRRQSGGGRNNAPANTNAMPIITDILQWGNDRISSSQLRLCTAFIDHATRLYPMHLTTLTLNTSTLSRSHLLLVQNILRQSQNLGTLHIECVPFEQDMEEDLFDVLTSIPWSTLRSLVLTGTSLEQWLELWAWSGQEMLASNVNNNNIDSIDHDPPTIMERPFLVHIELNGSGVTPQPLSHQSVLFLHQLLYTNPLEDLYIRNVRFQDRHDRLLILEAIHDLGLPTSRLSLVDFGISDEEMQSFKCPVEEE